jgi:hypothetical protein
LFVILVMTGGKEGELDQLVRDVGREAGWHSQTPVDAAPAGRGGADFVVGWPAAKLGAPRILGQAPGQLAMLGLRERDCWFQGYATVPQTPCASRSSPEWAETRMGLGGAQSPLGFWAE